MPIRFICSVQPYRIFQVYAAWNAFVIFQRVQGPTNFTMELTGPAVEQLASQSGDSNIFKQAVAALLPGISESPIFAKPS